MRMLVILTMLCFATWAMAQDQKRSGVGGSILLPEFDPARQTQSVLDSLGRLSSIQEAMKDNQARIAPMLANYQKNPTIENREVLERELAGITLQLSRNVERVLGEKEKVRFALQDLNRLSVTSERSVDAAVASLKAKAALEETTLGARRSEIENLARAVENADEADKQKALMAFKLAHRDFQRIQLRQQVLVATAQNHDNLLRGIRAVRRGFEAITSNLEDVFGRIEDAGSLLAFVAGIRKESSDLLGQYQRLFGSGSDSLREALTTLSSFEGQLQLVGSLTDTLDAAGSFATIVGQMENFSRTMLPGAEPGATPGTDDYWLKEVRKVTSGRFLKPEPKPALKPPTTDPVTQTHPPVPAAQK